MSNCTQPQYDFKIYCYLVLFSISLVFPIQILSMLVLKNMLTKSVLILPVHIDN